MMSKRLNRHFASILLALVLNSGFVFSQQQDPVKKALFKTMTQKLEQAREQQVPVYAPQGYQKVMELYREAKEASSQGKNTAQIKEQLFKASEMLDEAVYSARVSRAAMEKTVAARSRFLALGYQKELPRQFGKAELQYRTAMQKAEEGDIRSAREGAGNLMGLYRNITIDWLQNRYLKKISKEFEARRSSVKRNEYRRSHAELNKISNEIDSYSNKEFDPFQFRKAMLAKIDSIARVIYPPFYKNLPDTLLLGEFTLIIENYSNTGSWNFKEKQARGIAGTAWTHFGCGSFIIPGSILPGMMKVKKTYQVVPVVSEPFTQISLEEARLVKPEIKSGDQLTMSLSVEKNENAYLLQSRNDLLKQLRRKKPKGILVSFNDLSIRAVSGRKNVGRVVMGRAVYPAAQKIPHVIKLSVDGFIAEISALTLSPDGAKAKITLLMPQNMADFEDCRRARLLVGETDITYHCEFYKDNSTGAFGNWLIGNSGMVVYGRGFIADFSSTKGASGQPLSWKGVLLKNGLGSAKKTTPDSSNTGYLTADYYFDSATVTGQGFSSWLHLEKTHSFFPVNPLGYKITFHAGELDFVKSEIERGKIGPGVIELPITGICARNPGEVVKTGFTSFKVASDLDLSGKLQFESDSQISWGELSRTDDELLVWQGEPDHAYFYLPAGPAPAYIPVRDTVFSDFKFSNSTPNVFHDLDSLNMAGLTLANLRNLNVYSPDRPGGVSNPFKFRDIIGWLRIGSLGLDGQLKVYSWNYHEDLGEPARFGYQGNKAFDAMLSPPNKEKPIFFQYASSAVFDSEIDGSVKLPEPVKMDKLEFVDLETSSTAHLLGGDILLNVSGDTLDYWKLALVPTGSSNQAGVLSVRTGRILFTAAGIAERVHFKKPFGLTWGEFYADGNIGRLFFDYNTYGQRFDGQSYSAGNIILSKYTPGGTDGYLATCGTVHFNFFGKAYVNIKDARYDASAAAPYFKRYASVPLNGEAGCDTTDLHLQANWNNKRATFDFPNAKMKYNKAIQEGFIGEGKGTLSMIASNGLDAFIEIHKYAIDVRLEAANTVDLDFGLFARMGGIGQLAGCARIEGPQLKKISVWGYLEQSVATGMGILAPKTGYVVTTNMTITPNSTVVMASGDIMFSLAASAVDISGYVRLTADYSKSSIDGEIKGTINCNSVVGGLEGSGQVTWYLDPTSQHLQGRMKISVLGWSGGGGLEGGLFIGKNVPKSKAWVLETGNERFGVSKAILPDKLTGVYGYGQVSFSVNFYVFGGGIQLYAGMGAFTEAPPGLNGVWTVTGVGLPYGIGSAGVYVHGEILGGLVSAAAWGDLDIKAGIPPYFEGSFGLEGCVLWVVCGSVEVTAGISQSDGFYLY